jgi:Ca2+-binding RTX toxin-like protein
MYGRWGFRDSVNVDSGTVSNHYLSLDQGMVMAAIGNALGRDVLRESFADRRIERSLRPVIGIEEFGASPRGCTLSGTPRADRLRGTPGRDVICAGEGDDRIEARSGDDAVFGDGGDDRVDGDSGDDTLYGGDGHDRLKGGSGWDVISE